MPTRPNSMRLASATKRLPGPTMMSAAWPLNRPVGQGGDRLHAAERKHGVGAAQLHRVEDAGVHARVPRGRWGRDDVAHARHLRRADAHDRARGMGIAPARHVAAGRLARDQLLSRDAAPAISSASNSSSDSRWRRGEVQDAIAREADVVLHAGRERALGAGQIPSRRSRSRSVPAVELARIAPRCLFAAGWRCRRASGAPSPRWCRRSAAAVVLPASGTRLPWRPVDSSDPRRAKLARRTVRTLVGNAR